MSSAPRRVFLDWTSPFLPRVARWIVDEHGTDLAGLVVAVPGSRAARALVEHLARLAGPALVPPRVLTQGELVDELVRLDRPVAGRLARTLAWSRALRGLDAADIEALVAVAPASPREWLRLAEIVRTLHGDLAPEGLSFADVARLAEIRALEGEARRWDALARAQERWHALLDRAGVADPHEGRRAAIEAGHVDRSRRVVLAGVADMNRLLRQLLDAVGESTTALVFAPEGLADGFDSLGALRTDAWKERELPLELARWHVADRPQDEAELAVRLIARWTGRHRAGAIVIGVPDEEVVPALERRLAEHRVLARPAAGTPLAATRPARLLAAVAEFLARPTYGAWATLLRHPDLERAVASDAETGSNPPAEALDAYHAAHLPGPIPERWLFLHDDDPLPDKLWALERATSALLGPMWTGVHLPIAEWMPHVRALLEETYAAELRPQAREGDRVVALALDGLARGLEELEELPARIADEPIDSVQALELVLASISGSAVPPRATLPDEAAVELLGWLDLVLDDAPAMVVTGFNQGSVPRVPVTDGFLPESLRARLALPGDGERLARDVYAASALFASRAELELVSVRRSRDGDPRLPSRLAFHCPDAELAQRVRHYFAPRASAPLAERREAPPRRMLRRATTRVPTKLYVTAFADYLRSPYGFYLKHVLRLGSIDDRDRELDPLAFGTLAHEVLCDFGRDEEARDSTDPATILKFLELRLVERAMERVGATPRVAVTLQLPRLARRFGAFATAQAERRAAGWRIHAVEWSPTTPVELAGEKGALALAGRIDRVDVRDVDGRREWAILDYKTGDEPDLPEKVHRARDGQWRELQLPLYTLLARELGCERATELGYFALAATPKHSGVRLTTWMDADLDAAIAAAKKVVDAVLEGRFFEEGRDFPPDPAFEAILGRGLLVATGAEEGVDAEDDS